MCPVPQRLGDLWSIGGGRLTVRTLASPVEGVSALYGQGLAGLAALVELICRLVRNEEL